MNVIFWTIFLIATFTPKSSIYYRDFTNMTGFTIASTGLFCNGGFPAYYQRTGNGFGLVMTGVCAYIAYYTVKDEVKVIKARKQGLYLR